MKKTILVIEDEYEIRMDLIKTLRLSDYDTLDASNGKTGIELAKKNMPDLIISDIMMPEIDGYTVLSELQDNPDTSNIPFLFISAKSDHINVREGMTLGADDYITKPYDINELIDAVEVRLKKSEKRESVYNKKIEELRTSLRKSIPHEIRTPLNIILGLSEFLKKNYDITTANDAKDMLNNINDSGKRLHRLFENYLFYANIEVIASNRDEIENLRAKKCPLAEYIIKDIVTYMAGNAGRSSDIQLELDDAILKISETYFAKIVEEILDNAFKFSDRGTPVKIQSSVNKNMYSLSFTDYGRGMSDEQIENIGAYIQFERKVYEQQGSGLGITIVKRIIEMHKGDFFIESEPNHFTTVTIKLPCE